MLDLGYRNMERSLRVEGHRVSLHLSSCFFSCLLTLESTLIEIWFWTNCFAAAAGGDSADKLTTGAGSSMCG